mgnify:CR=1 FL=1
MKKYLIVGLGNIGSDYENTRHNIGFKILEELASNEKISFETGKLGDVATFRFKGRTFILLKPSTYMNLSGKAVKYWMDKDFPSLSSLSTDKRQEVLERARRETFTAKGESGKWARNFVGALLLGVGGVTAIKLVPEYLFGINPPWLLEEAFVFLGMLLMIYFFRRNYVKQISPKVSEIAQGMS